MAGSVDVAEGAGVEDEGGVTRSDETRGVPVGVRASIGATQPAVRPRMRQMARRADEEEDRIPQSYLPIPDLHGL